CPRKGYAARRRQAPGATVPYRCAAPARRFPGTIKLWQVNGGMPLIVAIPGGGRVDARLEFVAADNAAPETRDVPINAGAIDGSFKSILNLPVTVLPRPRAPRRRSKASPGGI